MAFGAVKGTMTASVASVTNPTSATTGGPITVAVGDLIFVNFAQQTALTATSVTDNLHTPTTYTPVNAGTDAGAATIRCFFHRVTIAGSLSTVDVTATASTNDASCVVNVVEGPFAASPIDANPANTTDGTTPFTCAATGARAQSIEVVMAAIAINSAQTVAATAPAVIAGTVNRANISSGNSLTLFTNSTLTFTPEFTGTTATAAQTVASFEHDSAFTVGAPIPLPSRGPSVRPLFYKALSFVPFVAAALAAGAGVSTGTCTVSGVGASLTQVVGSAAGAGVATGVGASLTQAAGSVAGSCTVSGVGASVISGVGSANGSCAVSAVGASVTAGVGNAAGTATVAGIGTSLTTAVGSVAGTTAVTGIGASLTTAAGTAAGTSTVSGVGETPATPVAWGWQVQVHRALPKQWVSKIELSPFAVPVVVADETGAGSVAGTCTVSGVGASLTQVVGSAIGTCTVTGISTSLAQAAGNATGTSTVSGVSASVSAASGSTAGTCSVSAVGASLVQVVGNASGASTATGVSAPISSASGSISGTCTVQGIATALTVAVGNAAGTSTVSGIALEGVAVGSASGTSTVSGVGAALVQAVGNASGASVVSGVIEDANAAAGGGEAVMSPYKIVDPGRLKASRFG